MWIKLAAKIYGFREKNCYTHQHGLCTVQPTKLFTKNVYSQTIMIDFMSLYLSYWVVCLNTGSSALTEQVKRSAFLSISSSYSFAVFLSRSLKLCGRSSACHICFHVVSVFGDCHMMINMKTGSLANTLFIQGCPGSVSCASIAHWMQPTTI